MKSFASYAWRQTENISAFRRNIDDKEMQLKKNSGRDFKYSSDHDTMYIGLGFYVIIKGILKLKMLTLSLKVSRTL
jgi:hypothetical protein